ncbi:copia protein [Tanacetum coccineum]
MMPTMTDNVIAAGFDIRPPMLDKIQYNSWQSRMLLYIKGKEHGKQLYDPVINGPFQYGTIEVPATPTTLASTRDRTYEDLIEAEKIRETCDIRATNIVLQGLPPDVYSLVNHHTVAKEIWDRLEWSKFVTDVKLAKDMHTTNFDQLYAYLRQHEAHANEVHIMRQRFPDPLSLQQPLYSPFLHQQAYESPVVHHYSPAVVLQLDSGLATQTDAGDVARGNAIGTRVIQNTINATANQSKVIRCYNCRGEGHIARHCTQPKRAHNSEWFKEKMQLAQAQEAGVALDEEQIAFLEDKGESVDSDLAAQALTTNTYRKCNIHGKSL